MRRFEIGTADVENALFLRKFAVPFWTLTHVFGHNDMYWYRMENSLGRNSIVGTTVSDPAEAKRKAEEARQAEAKRRSHQEKRDLFGWPVLDFRSGHYHRYYD